MSAGHWGEQFQWREKVSQRFPELWDLKIVRKRLPFVLKYLKDEERVLEIGAFDRSLEGRLKQFRPRILYKSLDIDPTYGHDYTSLEQVDEKFDLVLLFELIEHLDWESGREMVTKIFDILKPGGRVILTTPNIYTPSQYWKDVSHRTPYHYEELGGLFLSQRFESIELFRLFNDRLLGYVVKVYLFSSVFRFLRIDFTKSILLLARRA
ncbi:MAG TPA: methyltransferase domain-containing protein [Thermodesulfobacteriota bacterium]|nr:methyltransferase domain-containing protein [Thermodesulfobacteriota bacterium]